MNTMRGVYISLMLTSALLAGCGAFIETPPKYGRFLDTEYTEAIADPGRVLDERVKAGHSTRAGEGRYGDPVLCGFVDFKARCVWISRHMACPIEEIRAHEACHIDAAKNGIKDECHDGRSFTKK